MCQSALYRKSSSTEGVYITSWNVMVRPRICRSLLLTYNTPEHKTWSWVLEGRGEEPRPIAIALVLKGAITRLNPLALTIRSMAPRAGGTYGAMGMEPPGPLGPWDTLGVWGQAYPIFLGGPGGRAPNPLPRLYL